MCGVLQTLRPASGDRSLRLKSKKSRVLDYLFLSPQIFIAWFNFFQQVWYFVCLFIKFSVDFDSVRLINFRFLSDVI